MATLILFANKTIENVRLDNNICMNTDYIIGNNYVTRLIINNSSTNNGNPSSAGQWNGVTPQEGTIIRDTLNAKTYIYISGGYIEI